MVLNKNISVDTDADSFCVSRKILTKSTLGDGHRLYPLRHRRMMLLLQRAGYIYPAVGGLPVRHDGHGQNHDLISPEDGLVTGWKHSKSEDQDRQRPAVQQP